MKINLAENMLRFGVKNLSKSATNKVKTLAEQEQKTAAVTQPAAPQSITGTTFRYIVSKNGNGASYDLYKTQPLVTIDANGINIFKWTDPKTNRVSIDPTYVKLIEVTQTDAGASNVKGSFSIKDIMSNIPATIQVVDNIKSWLGVDLTSLLKMLVWVSTNYTNQAGCINSIIAQLQKVNDASFAGPQGTYNKLKSQKEFNQFMLKGTDKEWAAGMTEVPKKS